MCKPTVLRVSDNGIYPTSTPTLPELAPHSDNGDLVRHAIKCHFEDLGRSCRCLGNMHLFYREGTPDYVAPDIMMFPNLPADYPALHYKIWEDGGPALVVEILSKTTWEDDLGAKIRYISRHGRTRVLDFQSDPTDCLDPTSPAGLCLALGRLRSRDADARLDRRDAERVVSERCLGHGLGRSRQSIAPVQPTGKAWYASSEGNYAQKKEAERRAIEAEAEIERLQRLLRAQGSASNGQYPANGAG